MTKSVIQKTVTSDRAFYNAASYLLVTAANGCAGTPLENDFLIAQIGLAYEVRLDRKLYGHEIVP
jgi:hypothetical protein